MSSGSLVRYGGGSEPYFYQQPIEFIRIVQNTAPILLNPIQIGTLPTMRLGRKISLKHLQIGIQWHVDPAHYQSNYKWAIVYDRQCNGVAPTNADVWAVASASSHRNMVNIHRFKVIKEETRHIAPAQTSVGNTTAPTIRTEKNNFISLKGYETLFNTSSGTIGDIVSGSLWLMMISDQTSATNAIGITGHIHLSFIP